MSWQIWLGLGLLFPLVWTILSAAFALCLAGTKQADSEEFIVGLVVTLVGMMTIAGIVVLICYWAGVWA